MIYTGPVKLPENFVCEHKTLDLSCPEGELIKIMSANYGRTVSTFSCGQMDPPCLYNDSMS